MRCGTVWDVLWYIGVCDECDGMDSRYSEWDITGYSHFHLMDCPKGTMQWDTKYCWMSVGNGGHV